MNHRSQTEKFIFSFREVEAGTLVAVKKAMTIGTRNKMIEITRLLTEAIHDTSERIAGEARHPGSIVDDSENVIGDGRELVRAFRDIRQQVEDLTLVKYL